MGDVAHTVLEEMPRVPLVEVESYVPFEGRIRKTWMDRLRICQHAREVFHYVPTERCPTRLVVNIGGVHDER